MSISRILRTPRFLIFLQTIPPQLGFHILDYIVSCCKRESAVSCRLFIPVNVRHTCVKLIGIFLLDVYVESLHRPLVRESDYKWDISDGEPRELHLSSETFPDHSPSDPSLSPQLWSPTKVLPLKPAPFILGLIFRILPYLVNGHLKLSSKERLDITFKTGHLFSPFFPGNEFKAKW